MHCVKRPYDTISFKDMGQKPITVDEIYAVLALSMLMGIVQTTTQRSCFSKNSVLATPVFSSVISMDRFE
jgi:hypothetical protein